MKETKILRKISSFFSHIIRCNAFPHSGENLALARIVFAIASFFYFLFKADFFLQHTRVPYNFWQPTVFWRLTFNGMAMPGAYPLFFYLYLGSFFFLAIGFFTRFAACLNFLLSLIVLSYTNNFGCAYHAWNLLPFVAGILMLSNAGDFYSLDTKIFRKKREIAFIEYIWPVWLIQCFVLFMYFAAGIAKLDNWGMGFITEAGILRSISLTEAWFGKEYWLSGVPEYLRRFPMSASALSAFVLVLELAAPLFLFSARFKFWIFAALLLLQLGIILIMQLDSFWAFGLLYIFFVPWGSLSGAVAKKFSMIKAGGSISHVLRP